MKNQIIKLPLDSYIKDIEPFKSNGIPNNSIGHKTIPGCGITTFLYRYFNRNSIGVVSNVPVIKQKVEEHNTNPLYKHEPILGVHQGIDVNDIKAYLLKDIPYKRILTTPEGFVDKVLKAFASNLDELFNNYFLLYDECERIITDVSYRGKIAAPLDTFFLFKNKALVSATTLPFSDKRFDSFDHYTIEPTYDYSKSLTVINTNNVIASVKGHIDQLESDNVCIFLNSTRGIHTLIETLGIAKESKVFCSQESVVKLMELKYMNASNEFKVKDMAKYNFFTSRYFSAMDIMLEQQPDVIMVSDLYFADHSMLDPHTECIQIAGRFRNGVNSLVHITNFNPLIEVKTQDEALTYLTGCLDTYEHISELFAKATHNGTKQTLDFFVRNSPIASFFTEGKRNSFMIDNDLNSERVKNYYVNAELLKAAYQAVNKHFSVTYINEEYPVGDDDFYNLARKVTKAERYEQVAYLLDRYDSAPKEGIMFRYVTQAAKQQRQILIEKYPVIAEAYGLIGLKGLKATNYQLDEIHNAVRQAKKANEIAKLAPFVHKAFSENSIVPETSIIALLSRIYTEQGITLKAYATHIQRWYNATRSQRNGGNVYVIKAKLDVTLIHKN